MKNILFFLLFILIFFGGLSGFLIALYTGTTNTINTSTPATTSITTLTTTPTTTTSTTTPTTTTSTTTPTTTSTTTPTTTSTTTQTTTSTITSTFTSTTTETTTPTTTETTTPTTTETTTAICTGLANRDFETGNLDNWTILESFNATPAISTTNCRTGTYCLQEGIPSTNPAVCTKQGGGVNSAIYQNFVLTDCSMTILFYYKTIAHFTFNGTTSQFDKITASINMQNGGSVIATLLFFDAPFGNIAYAPYSCTACNGSCGGVDLTSFVGQTLSILLKYYSNSNQCGGVLWDDFCIQ